MAFLDDLYIVTAPSRARTALDAATQAVADHCGIGSNLGKIRAMAAKEGPPPPGIAELGDDVWRGDKPSAQRGIVVPDRSTPTPPKPGQTRGCRRNAVCLTSCLTSQTSFQCAWLLLLFCASPRANHALRTLPPSESSYARAHDQAVWETLQECLGGVPPAEAQQVWPLASLPAVHGGLGLQSAERTAPAAYWAAWMDALPVIRSRLPSAADRCLAALEQGAEGTIPCLREAAAAKNLLQREGWEACPGWHAAYEGAPVIRSRLPGAADRCLAALEQGAEGTIPCLREAAAAKNFLQREGWEACPGWHAAYEGARPPQHRDAGPGEWPHGWQFHATRTRNLTIATACCCRLCSHPLGPCYARKAVHGCQQSSDEGANSPLSPVSGAPTEEAREEAKIYKRAHGYHSGDLAWMSLMPPVGLQDAKGSGPAFAAEPPPPLGERNRKLIEDGCIVQAREERLLDIWCRKLRDELLLINAPVLASLQGSLDPDRAA
eukprot:s9130_g1.t1